MSDDEWISGRTVVSKPEAGVVCTDIHLTDKARRALTIDVDSLDDWGIAAPIPPPDPIVTAVRAEIRIRSWHMFLASGAGVLLANAAIWLLRRVGVL